LLDYVQTPYFTDALTKKEKGIISEEVKMGKNNPGHKLYYGMNNALYKKDKRKVLVTGEVEDVKGTTTEELQMVFDTFYHPQNMFLVITGNFNPAEAVAIVKENQSKKEFIEYKEPVVKREKEPRGVNEEYKEIECNVEIPKVKIAYKMPLEVFGDIDIMTLNIYLSVIMRNNFGSTSLLREELLEKELVTSIGSSRDIFNGLVTLEVGFETKYPTEVIPIIKEKMENLSLTKEEIKRRVRANIAALINDYDDIEYVNSDICDGLILYNKVFDNMYDIYNSLKLKEAKEIIEKIDLTDSTTVVLVPFKEE
jgi:predicted Zn-dependent peptidase